MCSVLHVLRCLIQKSKITLFEPVPVLHYFNLRVVGQGGCENISVTKGEA